MYIAILIVVTIVWFIGIISDSNEKGKREREQRQQARLKWGNREINPSLSLEQRNQDIIQKHLDDIREGYQRWYYIENCVRDCIQDIAEAEGNLEQAPNHRYLSVWLNSANDEYKELKDSLLRLFKDRYDDLQKNEVERKKQHYREQYDNLKQKYSHLIQQFYEVAERKVSLIDDYGQENWDALEKEIDNLVKKIAKQEGHNDGSLKSWNNHSLFIPESFQPFHQLADFLNNSFRSYHKEHKTPNDSADFSKMSGVDFESYLVKLLKESGFTNVRGTPTTGDQGADILAVKDNKTVVIQAKCYGGNVGNKAVQEVAGAVSYYGGDQGWVITNSIFTASAKQLAQKTGVILIDGYDLKKFRETV